MANVTTSSTDNNSMVITNNKVTTNSTKTNNIKLNSINIKTRIHSTRISIAVVTVATVVELSNSHATAITLCNQATQTLVAIATARTVPATYFMISTAKPFSVSKVKS